MWRIHASLPNDGHRNLRHRLPSPILALGSAPSLSKLGLDDLNLQGVRELDTSRYNRFQGVSTILDSVRVLRQNRLHAFSVILW